ncbi:uncharacterized protein LOC116430853 [Nomia melanderi]|uniref:uncharacterized protein LOC116430853 n=1 Tax=Nomia melanderi TaxID=2448451 RepID=UPI003FCE62C7
MTWFIIFVSLLVSVQSASGVTEYEQVAADQAVSIDLMVNGTATSCDSETNIKKKYPYDASNKDIEDRIASSSEKEICSVTIDSKETKDTGNWTITAHWNHTAISKTFKIYMKELVKAATGKQIHVVEGYHVHVKINADLTNLTNCILTMPNKTEMNMLTVKRKDMELFGGCGFRGLLNQSDSGNWALTAIVNDNRVLRDEVNIYVHEKPARPDEMNVTSLKRGAEGILNPVHSEVISCELRGPDGVQTPLIFNSCEYKIPVVTIRHEGTWTAVYSTVGMIRPTFTTFRVVTYASQDIDSNVTLTEHNEIQLLCHVYISEPQTFKFCHFTRPDGHVLNLSPGIGDAYYQASMVSYTEMEENHLYCGLIIRSLRSEDYGFWKCGIRTRKEKYYGTVIDLTSDPSDKYRPESVPMHMNITVNNVYARQGDSYEIKCTANAVLSYCWFRSPNGTAYSVSQSEPRTPFSLPYVGAGLPLGDCAAKIDHATFTDQGEWTCNVGVVNGFEEHETFIVNVAESYVIPAQSKLTAARADTITLSCNILPNVTDRAVHYCRWIRPDGYGIYNGLSHRYTTQTSYTWCKLIIAQVYIDTDIGNWTCVIGTIGSTIEESQATIILRSESKLYHTVIGVTLAISMTITIIISSMALVHVRKRHYSSMRNSSQDSSQDPPPYSIEPSPRPRFLRAESESKEFRY